MPMVREVAPGLSLKYNKFYIGLAKDGAPNNFAIFRPKKGYLRFEPRFESSEEVQKLLDDSGIDVMEYDARWGRYRIRLEKKDVVTHEKLIRDLMKRAYGGAEE